jgi:hypothetical protein
LSEKEDEFAKIIIDYLKEKNNNKDFSYLGSFLQELYNENPEKVEKVFRFFNSEQPLDTSNAT